jgi:MutS domain V
MDSDSLESPIQRYEKRAAHFSEEAGSLEARSRRYSNLRLAIVLIGVASVFIVPKNGPFWVCFLAGLLLFLVVLFVVVAVRHQGVEERLVTAREMASRNAEGKARITRNWQALPNRSAPEELASSMVARDLDLFGPVSLFLLICTANTWEGRKAVAETLVHGIERDHIPDRRAAVEELAPKLDFRQELECATLPLRTLAASEALFGSLQVDSTLVRQQLRRIFCFVAPLAVITLLTLNLAGLLPRWPCGLLITLNYAVSVWWGRKIKKDLKSAVSADRAIAHFTRAFRCVAVASLFSPELVSLKNLLAEASTKMWRLEGLVSLSKLPSSPIPGFGLVLNVLFLWNLHLAMAFEKWWTENGKAFIRWLTAIGKLEEICSFASLLHDNPNWAFPRFAPGDRIVAEGLAHPMIPGNARIANNVSVGPPGRILMVTGSNMSGKTTLLRAIGINVLLAKAGGPVCARKLELPWVEVVTSMRAMDSVTEGVSLFMAELSSIKVVVEAAHRASQKQTDLALYLLDEVLLGTNIDERKVITCRLILDLLRCRTIGAMSTHDLSLLHFPELASSCDKIHFQETFVIMNGRAEMRFDYRLHEGEAQSRNAIALMKHVGIELE